MCEKSKSPEKLASTSSSSNRRKAFFISSTGSRSAIFWAINSAKSAYSVRRIRKCFPSKADCGPIDCISGSNQMSASVRHVYTEKWDNISPIWPVSALSYSFIMAASSCSNNNQYLESAADFLNADREFLLFFFTNKVTNGLGIK